VCARASRSDSVSLAGVSSPGSRPQRDSRRVSDDRAPGIKSRLTSEILIIKETGKRDREGIMSWNQQLHGTDLRREGPRLFLRNKTLPGGSVPGQSLSMDVVGLLITSVTAFAGGRIAGAG